MAQADLNLRDVYRILRKRRWMIVLAPILTAIATYAMTEVPPPVYDAEALVRISRTSTVSALMTEIISYGDYDNMATQMMVVTSRPVLEEVAVRMGMVAPDGDTQAAAQQLKGSVLAEQRNFSDILAIQTTGGSEDYTVQLANTTAEVYIDQYEAERDRRIDDVVRFIEERLDEATTAQGTAERNLAVFRSENARLLGRDIGEGDIATREREFDYQRRLEDLAAARTRLGRIAQDEDYDALLETFLFVDDVGTTVMMDDLRVQAVSLAERRAEREDLIQYQLETAPAVQAADSDIALRERRIAAMIANLTSRIDRLREGYEDLYGGLTAQDQDLLQQIEARAELQTLEGLVAEAQGVVSRLRGQLQEAQIEQRERVDEITIVERALTASTVLQPARTYKALVGALIGLMMGGMLAFVLESLDTSIGTIEDVEGYIGSPVVGVIPHLDIDDVEESINGGVLGGTVSKEDVARFSRLVTHFDSRSVPSEAYRTLRTNVRTALAASNGKVVLVTSSMVQEGKTTTSVNLAATFAQTGKKTLLIDADLRRPNVDKIFGLNRVPGLSDFLLGTRTLDECIRTVDDLIVGKFGLRLTQWSPGLEYLHIMPAGGTVENPAELLQSAVFDDFIRGTRDDFDIVIVDVSPVLPVADSYVIAPHVDGILLTYQIGRVARDVLHRTKQRLESLGANVLGIVMNDIRSEIDYKQGDFQYYQYRYEGADPPVESLAQRLAGAVRKVLSGRKKR